MYQPAYSQPMMMSPPHYPPYNWPTQCRPPDGAGESGQVPAENGGYGPPPGWGMPPMWAPVMPGMYFPGGPQVYPNYPGAYGPAANRGADNTHPNEHDDAPGDFHAAASRSRSPGAGSRRHRDNSPKTPFERAVHQAADRIIGSVVDGFVVEDMALLYNQSVPLPGPN